MESRSLVYLPFWLKLAIVVILMAALAGAVWLLIPGQADGLHPDLRALAINLLPMTITALLVLAAVAFSERDANSGVLLKRTRRWLTQTLPDALRRAGTHTQGDPYAVTRRDTPIEVTVRLGASLTKVDLLIQPAGHPELALNSTVVLNVRKLSMFFYLPVTASQTHDRLESVFGLCVEGARAVGYTTIIERENAARETTPRLSLWLYADVGDEFLTRPADQLYWAQDIGQFARCLLYTAWLEKIVLNPLVAQPDGADQPLTPRRTG